MGVRRRDDGRGRHRDARLRGSRPLPRDADRPRRRHGARHRDRDRHGLRARRRDGRGAGRRRPWRASARRCAPTPPGRTSRSRSGAAACRWPSRSSRSTGRAGRASLLLARRRHRHGHGLRGRECATSLEHGGNVDVVVPARRRGRALGRRDARRVERGRRRVVLAQLPERARHLGGHHVREPRRALVLRPQVQGLRAVGGLPRRRGRQQRWRAAALPGAGERRRRRFRLPGRDPRQWRRGRAHGRDHAGTRHGHVVRAVERDELQAHA